MQNQKTNSSAILSWMILLSLALGIFISYFFVFVNTLFISQVGTSKLPLAYVFSGIGGTLITYLFNSAEKKWGFARSSTLFCLFFAVVIFTIWYLFVHEIYLYELIFFSYAWFWVSINFTGLVFWKLPSNIFDLNQNKKYNGIISSGEVISAIIAYLSVPLLLTLDFFTRDKLLLISFFGISAFSIISLILGKYIKNKPKSSAISAIEGHESSRSIIQERYFQLLFLSIFLAVIVQLLIDFSLMEVSADQLTDPTELAQYFAFLYGGMRLMELLMKTFISKYIVKEYGVLISLTTMIAALALIAVIGISSLLIGYFGLILIVASLSKVFERSLYRSIYAPTINVLYQAYPASKRALTQNYADGFGKTIGQLIAALLIFGIATIDTFESRVFIVLGSVLVILLIWFIVSKKLIDQYKLELSSILKMLGNKKSQILQPVENSKERETINLDKQESLGWEKAKTKPIHDIPQLAKQINGVLLSASSTDLISEDWILKDLETAIASIKGMETYQLKSLLQQLTRREKAGKKLFELFQLLILVTATSKSSGFNFHQTQVGIRSLDFLASAMIQTFASQPVRDLSYRDFDFILEERIQKYTYLLASYRDMGKSSSELSQALLLEAQAAKHDILYSLHFKYDSDTLDQILLMLYQDEKTQELIALELLELVLEEQDKKWILPIFREENIDAILGKLEAEFTQVQLGKEKRLLAIVGNSIQDIPLLIKSKALTELAAGFGSICNQQLSVTLAKNGQGIVQETASHLVGIGYNGVDSLMSNQEENSPTAEIDSPEDTGSSGAKTLAHAYWIRDIRRDFGNSSAISMCYQTLYQAVFTMEKLS